MFLPCLLFGLRRTSIGACKLLDGFRSWFQNVGLASKRAHASENCLNLLTSVLVPRVSHRLPLSPSGGPPSPTSRSGPRSYGVIGLLLVPMHMKPCLCSLRMESVSPSPVEPLYSSSTGLQSQIALGAPSPDARPAGWGV